MLCSCHLDISQASLPPNTTHSSLPRVRDWSTVVAACHHSLSAWHQSLLVHVSGPRPDFPARASTLDSHFDSLTRILFGCASLHSRRHPRSRPRARQPLWWNDAWYHALVARNGAWRDFRRSGSHEDQARFRFLRQQFHSTVRSSRTHCWNELLGSVASLSRRAPRLACSLIRCTFRSSVATPDPCHMQWHGASRSALPPDEARSQWHAHFSYPAGDSQFSDDFFHSLSLRFASLTSLHESGRFDASFSYNELDAALSKCQSLRPVRTTSQTHSSNFHSHGGVIFSVPSSTSTCASLWFRPLGSPASSSRSSSAMVTPPPLIPIAPFLSHLALSDSSST